MGRARRRVRPELVAEASLWRIRIDLGDWHESDCRRVCVDWGGGRRVWYSGSDTRVLVLWHRDTGLEVA